MTAPVSTELGGMDDAVLIALSWREPEHFAVLFDRHASILHRYVAGRLGTDVAEDIVSETFLAAFRQRRKYDMERTRALPWLYGIATNLIRRHQRSEIHRYRAYERTGRFPDSIDHAERVLDLVSAQSMRRRLAAALARLHSRDRDVLMLVACGELTHDEIARALGIPAGTVRSRLHRARAKVRQALGADPTLEA